MATKLAPELLAPIAVAAYSYMSLIPIIQPPLMKLMTTKKERLIRMDYAPKPISQKALTLFPIILTLVVGLLVPEATALISMLMLGNLLKVSGVVDRLSQSAQNEIINISTLFLGLAIGGTMSAAAFLNLDTGKIMVLGLIAFVLDTVAGLLFGKLMCAITGVSVALVCAARTWRAWTSSSAFRSPEYRTDPRSTVKIRRMGPISRV